MNNKQKNLKIVDLNDSEEYASLLKKFPEGKIIASEKEQKEFDEFLFLNKKELETLKNEMQ